MGKIQNFEELAVTPGRRVALEIAEAGLATIDTESALEKNVRLESSELVVRDRRFVLGTGKLLVMGIGKCALGAGRALERILGDRLSGGVVLDVHEGKLSKLAAYVGTHPLSSEQNVVATRAIIDSLGGLTEDDTVLFVVSGGGSALLCQPNNFTCEEEAVVMKCLLKSGADIESMNTVRKHLSRARGGFLAQYAYPANVISLIFSDVPGDDLQFIASGPTVPDTTTVADAAVVLKRFDTANVCGFIGDRFLETPKDQKYFKKVANVLFVTNRVALDAMQARATELGYAARIVTPTLTGESRDAAVEIVRAIDVSAPGTVLLYGGETAVTVRHSGKGGRMQELGLSALRFIASGEVLCAFGSDGRDNTDHAGVLCDTMAKERAAELALDLQTELDTNTSYDFWNAVGGYLMTGDTGSNVSDLIIALRELPS
jgi:glycerate 2-kinase